MLLGFTATPLRGDGKSLAAIYKEQSFKMTLQEATQKGYICPVHGLRINFKYDIKDIKNTAGDYDLIELDKIINCEEINDIVAFKCSTVMRLPAIVFCSSVDHATKIKDKLVEMGRKAEVISYLNSKSECVEIIRKLKANEIEFILNAVKLTEGFDHPPIQTIVLARPTRSPALYKQMIGRGLRLHPNKYDCLVMEFTGNDSKMITWDQIDTDCSFQCYSPDELIDRKRAIQIYKNKFLNPDVKILDVRVSTFSFYECRIQRLKTYKQNYIFIPIEEGFILGHLKKDYVSRNKLEYQIGKTMICYMLFWKKQYLSFFCYSYGKLWDASITWTREECVNQLKFYADKCMCVSDNNSHPAGRWYPSEEEKMSPKQIKLLPNIKTNARKAEMLIEERAIIKALNKFWIEKDFPVLALDEEGTVTDRRIFTI